MSTVKQNTSSSTTIREKRTRDGFFMRSGTYSGPVEILVLQCLSAFCLNTVRYRHSKHRACVEAWMLVVLLVGPVAHCHVTNRGLGNSHHNMSGPYRLSWESAPCHYLADVQLVDHRLHQGLGHGNTVVWPFSRMTFVLTIRNDKLTSFICDSLFA